MKKKGSALVYVLAISSVLLMLTTIISASVINTVKLNGKHSDLIDLELAAKSGLNMFREQLILEINAAKTSSNLPNTIPEVNSGISDFGGISINKKIVREEVREGDVLKQYRYTIYSKAIDNNNNSYKELNQVIAVNINNGSIGEVELNPKNFMNVVNNVSLGYSNLSCLDYISFGGTITSQQWEFNQPGYTKPGANNELKETKIEFNNNNYNKFLKEKEKDEYIPFVKGDNFVEIYGKDVKNNTFDNLVNKNVIVNGDVFINSGEVNIKLDNSILIINGKFEASTNTNIEIVNGGKLIVNGKVLISNSLNVNINQLGLLEINGEVATSGKINISINNSEAFIKENFKSKNSFEINLNNSKLEVLGELYAPGNITANLRNISRLDIGTNINSDSGIILDSEDESIIYINEGIKANSVINVKLSKNSILIVKGYVSQSATGYKFEIVDSILIAGNLNAPGSSNFIIDKSILVANKITSQSNIKFNMNESNLIVKDEFFINSGLNVNMNNSSIICMNLFKPLYTATITNISKSYILSAKDFETSGITIVGGENGFVPDSNIVIESTKYFITKN